MANSKSSKLHIVMYPYFAYGHLSSFLNLSNHLAHRGHKVSFLLPQGTIPNLTLLNRYPNLLHFVPIQVPHVDGLPLGAETTADIPFSLHKYLSMAIDLTRTQLETLLADLKPHLVLYDHAFWVPSIGRNLGFKSVYYVTVSAAACGRLSPDLKIVKGMKDEELLNTPPGYPLPSVLSKVEIAQTRFIAEEFGSGLSLYDRMIISAEECDVIAIKTCREIEGIFIDYISKMFSKKVLLTGHLLAETTKETSKADEDERWEDWLNKFGEGSVVYCAFGSEIALQKDQFQELLLAFESSGCPFLVALKPPNGYKTIEEAIPEGFEDRTKERGCVYGSWVPQKQILKHPSVGCFVSHCGFSSIWECLLSDCQMVMIPQAGDQFANAMLMGRVLKVGVEVEMEENGWVKKERLCEAIEKVMDTNGELGMLLKANHVYLKNLISAKNFQEKYIDDFLQDLEGLLE